MFQFRSEEIAEFEKTSIEEARLKYRHLELNEPEDGGNGVQITLFDDEASVTVPFWHDNAAAVFREIWSYLSIISRETGYVIYDPQIDRIIDPSGDFDEALACYAQAMRQIHQIDQAGATTKRPWWKFW